MSKERIVYKTEIEVSGLWTILGTYSTKVTGYIKLIERKFLWWKLKPCLEIYIYTPYLKSPTYDGEYSTNRMLGAVEVRMRAVLEEKKDAIQRKLDRLLKRK